MPLASPFRPASATARTPAARHSSLPTDPTFRIQHSSLMRHSDSVLCHSSVLRHSPLRPPACQGHVGVKTGSFGGRFGVDFYRPQKHELPARPPLPPPQPPEKTNSRHAQRNNLARSLAIRASRPGSLLDSRLPGLDTLRHVLPRVRHIPAQRARRHRQRTGQETDKGPGAIPFGTAVAQPVAKRETTKLATVRLALFPAPAHDGGP